MQNPIFRYLFGQQVSLHDYKWDNFHDPDDIQPANDLVKDVYNAHSKIERL